MSRKQQRRTRDRHMAFVRGRIVHLNDLHLRCAIIVWDQSQVDEMFRVCPPETNPQRRRRIVEENRAARNASRLAAYEARMTEKHGDEWPAIKKARHDKVVAAMAEHNLLPAPGMLAAPSMAKWQYLSFRSGRYRNVWKSRGHGFRERNGRRSAIGAT